MQIFVRAKSMCRSQLSASPTSLTCPTRSSKITFWNASRAGWLRGLSHLYALSVSRPKFCSSFPTHLHRSGWEMLETRWAVFARTDFSYQFSWSACGALPADRSRGFRYYPFLSHQTPSMFEFPKPFHPKCKEFRLAHLRKLYLCWSRFYVSRSNIYLCKIYTIWVVHALEVKRRMIIYKYYASIYRPSERSDIARRWAHPQNFSIKANANNPNPTIMGNCSGKAPLQCRDISISTRCFSACCRGKVVIENSLFDVGNQKKKRPFSWRRRQTVAWTILWREKS